MSIEIDRELRLMEAEEAETKALDRRIFKSYATPLIKGGEQIG